MLDLLKTPIVYLKGVGPAKSEVLKMELGIFTYEDLLYYFPYRYVDKSKIHTISEISDDLSYIQLKGQIRSIQIIGEKRTKRLVAKFEDETGSIDLIWFNSIKWIVDSIRPNTTYLLFGKPSIFNRRYNITHPELDVFSNETKVSFISFQPLYNTSEKLKKRGVDSRAVSKMAYAMLQQIKGSIPENLSADIIQQNNLLSREEALFNIHYPADKQTLARAIHRIKFEELFFNQLNLYRTKQLRLTRIRGHEFPLVGDFFNTFYHEKLPFELTQAQKKVIKEIRADLKGPAQMNRLLQGDVGSGKTVVALMTMLIACDNNYQSCIMTPTEVLAQQHFATIKNLLADMDVNVEILTGSARVAARRKILENLANGTISIVIGTHALIEDRVVFKNLGLTIIDEQHRFGVAQRAKLWGKNNPIPHVLVMTATPIPRTLAMTLFGDLNVSIIDELPKNRKPIKTMHFYDKNRLRIQGIMREEIAKGRQIYVVFPLIEESETLDLKHVNDGLEALSHDFPLPDFAISVVHGKLKPEEKQYEMDRFKKGETNILISTTVIEVGVDVPNASVMIIEDAQRFGLLQLHQLRGRVGRGAEQSYCILVTGYDLTQDGKDRISAMLHTNDGFEIANLDLKIRGPGDIDGTRQSGLLDFKLADLSKDDAILLKARQTAESLLKVDPEIEKTENTPMKKFLLQTKYKTNWVFIS
ncbi:MAG: ATP-dependent DNA helicase RecG [Bacteroidales bacterium]|nr:ATP-dependent DNA helicase RecG [Bacteroidales bacterium]